MPQTDTFSWSHELMQWQCEIQHLQLTNKSVLKYICEEVGMES